MLAQAAEQYGFGAKTRVGYGRLAYIKDIDDLKQEIPGYDAEQLADLFKRERGKQKLHDAFRAETDKRSYDKLLDKLFRKFRPYVCLLNDLETRKPADPKAIKTVYEGYEKALKGVEINLTDSAVQAVFSYCQPIYAEAGREMPAWLGKLAPTTSDCLAGKSMEQVEKLLDNYQQQYPPLADFKEAIKLSRFDDEEKGYFLELYFAED
jgi:hypothetical protein